MEESVRAATESQVREGVISSVTGLSAEAYDAAVEAGEIDASIQDAVRKAVETRMASDEIRNAIASAVETQMDSDDIKQTIASTIDSQMASDTVKQQISNATDAKIQELINEGMESEEVQKKLAEAEEGAKAVIALKTSLDKYNAFYLGVLAYTGAVDQAAAGARDVTSGSEDLAAGAAALSEGCCELSEKLFEFSEGAETIRDGSSDLKDGISRFDKEAVKRMSDFVNKDLSDYSDKLRAVTNIGRKYRNGYPLSNGSDGRYRYVFKSDSF